MRRLAITIAVAVALPAFVQCAAAQDAARCGGLFCDLGIVGNPNTSLPCNDFVCRTFGYGRQAEAAPAVVPPPSPEPKAPESKPPKRHRKAAAAPAAK